MPLRYLAGLGLMAAVAVTLLVLAQPYQQARLTSFLHPWSSKSTAGFQAVQGQIALGSGGLLGVGLGHSVQKIFYLPEAQTDFILAVIGEELGVLGIFGVVFLYGMIAYAGLRTARRAAGRYAKLLATGLTSLILCQGILNIFVVLGLAPLTGVPLPFISYAPTNLCVMLAAIGLLLNISRPGARRLQVVDAPERERTRIVIGAGGTAGHVVPALAVADALRAEGAEVPFVGGERAELELVPAAGYELRTADAWSRCLAQAGDRAARAVVVDAGGPARGRAGSLSEIRPGGRARCRRLRGGAGGAGGPEPAHPARADGGRQPSGADESRARPAGAARVPRVPDRRSRRTPLPGHRSPGARAGDRPPSGPGPVLRFPSAGDLRARVRRIAGGAIDQPSRGRGIRRGALSRAARRRRARPRRAARPPGPTTTCAGTSATSARRCSPATSSSPARGARSSRSPPRAVRPS